VDAVKLNKAPFRLFHFKAGMWVEFSNPEKPHKQKHRGCIMLCKKSSHMQVRFLCPKAVVSQ